MTPLRVMAAPALHRYPGGTVNMARTYVRVFRSVSPIGAVGCQSVASLLGERHPVRSWRSYQWPLQVSTRISVSIVRASRGVGSPATSPRRTTGRPRPPSTPSALQRRPPDGRRRSWAPSGAGRTGGELVGHRWGASRGRGQPPPVLAGHVSSPPSPSSPRSSPASHRRPVFPLHSSFLVAGEADAGRHGVARGPDGGVVTGPGDRQAASAAEAYSKSGSGAAPISSATAWHGSWRRPTATCATSPRGSGSKRCGGGSGRRSAVWGPRSIATSPTRGGK